MANVVLVSYHNGSVPTDVSAETPSQIATDLNLSLSGVEITVEGETAAINRPLRDGDLVTFQKGSVKSGN